MQMCVPVLYELRFWIKQRSDVVDELPNSWTIAKEGRYRYLVLDRLELVCLGKHKRKMVIQSIKLTGKQPATIDITQQDHSNDTKLRYYRDKWSIFSWTPNQKITAMNMLVHSIPFTDNEFMHETCQRWVFMKLTCNENVTWYKLLT